MMVYVWEMMVFQINTMSYVLGDGIYLIYVMMCQEWCHILINMTEDVSDDSYK